jgi:hypothetical protein
MQVSGINFSALLDYAFRINFAFGGNQFPVGLQQI